jgi:hypothetical protein
MTPLERAVRADPATSYWLTAALDSTARRDPLDALRDCEMLLEIAGARLLALQQAERT